MCIGWKGWPPTSQGPGALGAPRARDGYFRQGVVEDVTHAWYKGSGALHPWKGETNPDYTDFKDDGKYTWVKAPRGTDRDSYFRSGRT